MKADLFQTAAGLQRLHGRHIDSGSRLRAALMAELYLGIHKPTD